MIRGVIVRLCLILGALSSAAAATPMPGQPLPALEIHDKGELHLVERQILLRPWRTENLRGQWTLLQYLAARPEASRLNRPAIDAIGKAAKAGGYRPYRLVNIVNVDDVPFGATAFAMSALERNKRQYPDAPMIADMGHGREHWQLAPGGSAMLLIDENLVVRHFVDGAVDDAGVERMLDLLRLPQEPAR